jgi:hypothetical protein
MDDREARTSELTVASVGEDGREVERLDQVRPDELVEGVVNLRDSALLNLHAYKIWQLQKKVPSIHA